MKRSEISSYEQSYKLDDYLEAKLKAGLIEEIKGSMERGDDKRIRTLYRIEGSRIVVVADRYVPYNEEVRAEPKIREELKEAGIISSKVA